MKKTVILLFLIVFGFSFAYPEHVTVKQIGLALQHGRPRAPSITRLEVDYESGTLTLNVSGYSGSVQVYVSNAQGNIVGYKLSTITGSGVVTMDLGTLAEGNYVINIALDNASYYGEFES